MFPLQAACGLQEGFARDIGGAQGRVDQLLPHAVLVTLERFRAIEAQIAQADGWIESIMKQSALCQRIAAIPGVGAMTATAMVAAVGDAKAFNNGRHLAA